VSGNVGVIVDIPTNLVKLTDPLARSIDCWDHNEACVVCGLGGCFTYEYSASGNYTFVKHFFHKKFFFMNGSNAKVFDLVYDVKTLRLTTYFFTIESMKGEESAGLMRWDTTRTNCYVRHSAKIDDKGREYYLDPVRYTKNIMVASPGNNAVYVYSITDISNPLISIVYGALATDPVIGRVASITRGPERHLFVSCSNRPTN
jgi:hypothetical protein